MLALCLRVNRVVRPSRLHTASSDANTDREPDAIARDGTLGYAHWGSHALAYRDSYALTDCLAHSETDGRPYSDSD